MKKLLKWGGGLVALVLVALSALVANALWFRPVSLSVLFERTFLLYALKDPELLTSIGLLEGLGIQGHNAKLTDASPAQDRWGAEFAAHELATLRSFDREELEGQTALSWDILEWFLDQSVRGKPFLWHGYVLSQFGGAHIDLPDFMVSQHRIDSPRGAEHYVARLELFPVKFGQIVENLKLRESQGILPPRFVVEAVIGQCRDFRGVPPEENVLMTSFEERIGELDGLDDGDRDKLEARVLVAIESSVYPAYDALIAYHEGLRERVDTDHGVWAHPDGDAYYDHLLRGHTTTDLGADEIHARGLAEMERIQAEMDAILQSEGYLDGTVAERMSALREEERFAWGDSDDTRDQILERYREIIEEIDAAMGEWFVHLPRSEVEVVRVPEYREDGAAGASYRGPSLDGARPGRFMVNLRDPREHYRFGMRTLAFHEAVPGHHFQTSLQAELTGVPQFRRLIPFTAFSEGWALYAERLAKEAGFQQDPYDDLGRLQAELFRAVRLVVDTGIHRQRWSRGKAIEVMEGATGMAHSEVVTEIERYFVRPGQATSYKVGMMKILDLRERAKAALGPAFDIREFHERTLRNGDVPLTILEGQIEAWIEESGAT